MIGIRANETHCPTLRAGVQLTLLVGVFALLGPREASAQTNSEVNSGIQFDFPLPGARSLGTGGAFVAIADDATAAVANPAGLTALLRPEVSVEGRAQRFVSVTPLRGHAFGTATNIGVDTISGVVNGETSDAAGGPSFASAVFPRGRFAVGIYRHEQARFRADIVSEGPFMSNPGGADDRLPPFTGVMELDIVNYGVAVAYRFNGGLAVGGGVAFSDFSIDSRVSIFYAPPDIFTIQPPSDRVRYTGVNQVYGPVNFAESSRLGDILESGDDHGEAFNFGALYRPAGNKWSVGGALRLNPEFQYGEGSIWGPAHPDPSFPGTPIVPPITVAFKVPDVYSIGAAFHATAGLLLTAQYDRVQFSQLSRDLQDVNGPDGGEAHRAVVQGLKFPDSNQARFGSEYALVRGSRVTSFRIGTAYESAHRMAYTQTTPTRFTRLEVLYPPGEGQWHVTPGFGLAFPRFQIDSAVDLSSRTRTFSLSTVVRF